MKAKQREELLSALRSRFEKSMHRHKGIEWTQVQAKLEAAPEKLWSLNEMERTGGERDVVGHDKKTREYIADRRYGAVFVYHNGAAAYFGGRGFRSSLRV